MQNVLSSPSDVFHNLRAPLSMASLSIAWHIQHTQSGAILADDREVIYASGSAWFFAGVTETATHQGIEKARFSHIGAPEECDF